jgi:hypothetical protein
MHTQYEVPSARIFIRCAGCAHMEYSWPAESETRLACTEEATTRSSDVLLHPGGPYSSTPWAGCRPSRRNEARCRSGHSTACLSLHLVSCMALHCASCVPWACSEECCLPLACSECCCCA